MGIGLSPTLFWSRCITGNDSGFLPLQCEITTVVGKPARVKNCDGKASTKEINKVRGRFVQALTGRVDEYTDQCAPHRKENMKIVA